MSAISRRGLLVVLSSLAVTFVSGCGQGCAPDDVPKATPSNAPPTTVYIVRHAEKGEGKDPDLSDAGKMRALELPRALPVEDLAAIYSTAMKRTEQTASPVSAISGLPVTRMPPDDFDGLKERVEKHRGHAILVVGHSNTVPAMIAALGVVEPVELTDSDYGDLFVITVPAQGVSTLRHERFGEGAAPPSK